MIDLFYDNFIQFLNLIYVYRHILYIILLLIDITLDYEFLKHTHIN